MLIQTPEYRQDCWRLLLGIWNGRSNHSSPRPCGSF